MTVRRALQLSLNVPAVAVLDRIGASRFAARLQQAGASLVLPHGEVPGLAMGLGGVGVKLADLVALYAGLARLGTTVPLSEQPRANAEEHRRRAGCSMPVAAWYVGNILLGTPPPENAAGGRIAFKTGTSYGYRDAWAVGFDGKRTIGVWVGRPDGAPVPGLTGRARGGTRPVRCVCPHRKIACCRLPQQPDGALVAATGKLPPPLQRFPSWRIRSRHRRAAASHHVPARWGAPRARER